MACGSFISFLALHLTQFSYPAIDSSSFTWTKSVAAEDGLEVTNSWCLGEPFPGERSVTASIPSGLDLKAGPNPFNPTTAISYELRAASFVSLKVYDTAGRLVATLVDGMQEAGEHRAILDGSRLASGIYLARLEIKASDSENPTYTGVQKLMLVK